MRNCSFQVLSYISVQSTTEEMFSETTIINLFNGCGWLIELHGEIHTRSLLFSPMGSENAYSILSFDLIWLWKPYPFLNETTASPNPMCKNYYQFYVVLHEQKYIPQPREHGGTGHSLLSIIGSKKIFWVSF